MNRFKKIMCVVETGKPYRAALERAISLAENNQASLTVIEVIPRIAAGIGLPDGGPISIDLQAAMVTTHTKALVSLTKPYSQSIKIDHKVLLGTPFIEVIREVLRGEYDLVVKLPEVQDWLDRLFGSNDMHLLRKCPCPVWLIKPTTSKSYKCILAAVDTDDSYPEEELAPRHELNRQILEMASSQALSNFAELHVVHAWDAIGEQVMHGASLHIPEKDINNYVRDVKRHHTTSLDELAHEVTGAMAQETVNYLKLQKHLVRGSARKEIPALAREIKADLVVMGTVVRTGVAGFLMGNTAETILNQLDCSVLAIKPPGFITPVMLED